MYQKPKMLYLLAVVILIAFALATPSLVFAGGWVVITLDKLPADVVAGEPYTIGFMARQHGQTPWQVEEMRIEAQEAYTGQTATFFARPDQPPGHYTAELLFPAPGQWEWGIQSGMHPPLQPMPAVVVAESGAAVNPAKSAQAAEAAAPQVNPGALFASNRATVLLGVLALLAFAGGLALILRGRNQTVVRLVGGGLIVLCGVLVFALLSTANAQATAEATALANANGQAQQNKPVPVTASSIETGRNLFLAKGCVVCHTNSRAIKNSGEYGVSAGPDLSNYNKEDAYLRAFLANPWNTNATSDDFPMPNLNLSQGEIDALVSFINEGASK